MGGSVLTAVEIDDVEASDPIESFDPLVLATAVEPSDATEPFGPLVLATAVEPSDATEPFDPLVLATAVVADEDARGLKVGLGENEC